MKTTKLPKTTLTLAAAAFLAATSQAAVINIDVQGTSFGGTVADYTGVSANGPIASDNTWTYFNTVGVPDAGDSITVSGVTFTFGTGWGGTYGNAPNQNNLQADRAFTTATGTGTFTISGLTPFGLYDLALITDLQSTDYTIGTTTMTASGGDLGALANGALTFTGGVGHALFSGISASDLGDITFSTTAAAGSNNGVLTGLQIDAVPEPSSAALLGLGGLALILRRRK